MAYPQAATKELKMQVESSRDDDKFVMETSMRDKSEDPPMC